MFLGEALKKTLNDLLLLLRETQGIVQTCPYRDKSDQTACLLLEHAEHAVVNTAGERVNGFMKAVLSQMRCVQLLLTDQQRKLLIVQDLVKVKDIQGRCGVHILLDPQSQDLSEVVSGFDLRIPATEYHHVRPLARNEDSSGESEETRSSSAAKQELVSVIVTNASTSRNITASFVRTNSSSQGWNLGVNSLLLLLDHTADLSPAEVEQLDAGEVLVNTDNVSGKRVLRVRSSPSVECTAEKQMESLGVVLNRGLAAAESLKLSAVAVMVPAGVACFSAIPPQTIKSMTAETVVQFVRRAPVRHLELVLCVDVVVPTPEDPESACIKYSLPTCDASELLPAGGDPMASAVISMLEQENESFSAMMKHGGGGGRGGGGGGGFGHGGSAPTMQLLLSNVPLPRHISAEVLIPSMSSSSSASSSSASSRQRTAANTLSSRSGASSASVTPVVVRGLASSLLASVQLIRRAVQST